MKSKNVLLLLIVFFVLALLALLIYAGFLISGNSNETEPETIPSPDITTLEPGVTTATPIVTTTTPGVTTKAPEVTTKAPEVTTKTPEVTTKAPEVTTKAPEVTTKAPEVTTKAPEVTTAAPEVTTAAPEVTTAAPEVTTAAPEVTYPALNGRIISTNEGYLKLVVEWSTLSRTASEATVEFKIKISCYSIYVSARNGGKLTVGGQEFAFSSPKIEYDGAAGKSEFDLASQTVTLPLTNGEGTFSISCSWPFRGTYSGIEIQNLTLDSVLNIKD